MQQANSELSEKSGLLQAEKKILEEEIKRWKARTQVGLKLFVIRLLRPLFYSLQCSLSLFVTTCQISVLTLPSVLFPRVCVAFGESAERFRSRGVQASTL